ncbi:putative HSP20 family protein [Paratrimastix pyriformis]|uniref:HSP20 family protein n=1 Tax=Paratrimastix pyriformis TaxID=342808 RepID=A0ABQ8UUJ9_9EUKA|nr:putative HSP20 family protein [Paratrimastix pyriformis]
MFGSLPFRDLQHAMNSLFGDFATTHAGWYWHDPFEELDELRNSVIHLFDAYPLGQPQPIADASTATPKPQSSSDTSVPATQTEKTAPPASDATATATAATSAPAAPSAQAVVPRPTDESRAVRPRSRNVAWLPRCDVEETPTEIVVHAELPGVAKEDTKLEVDPQRCLLTLSGHRQQRTEEGGQPGSTFHRIESVSGSFRRTFRLPETCRPRLAEISARSENGIIEVHCPKAEPAPEAAHKSINITIQ